MRRFIYPVTVASSANLAILPVMFRGPQALWELDFDFADFAGMVGFVTLGLLLVGFPTVQWLAGTYISLLQRIAILTLAGSVGGYTIFLLIFFFNPYVGLFGIVPGVLTASVWASFNLDFLSHRPKGKALV
jgi:hypothetical protein